MISATDFYTYDAAGLTTHIEVPATNSIHTSVGYDGDGRQVRTDETTWDPETETEVTDTKYFVRSSVLGGQVLTELLAGNGGRTFVYANQAIIAWQWLSSGWEVVDFEHKDPSGASVRRGSLSQELDPLGGDAGIAAQTQIPDEGLVLTQGSSYNSANPGITYSRDGIRVPADDFMAFAGVEMLDTLGLVEAYARQRVPPGLPPEINPEDVPWDQIATDLALLAGKGIPDLLALLPQFSLAKQLSNHPSNSQNPAPNVNDLKSRITKMVSNPDCANFISNLINRTATAKNPAEFTDALIGFGKIKSQSGFIYGDTIQKAYGFVGATFHGSISGGKAQVELPTPAPFPVGLSRRGAAEYVSDQGRIDAEAVLHEILHLAGKNGYDDFAFANTVAAMNGVKLPDYSGMDYRDAVRKASDYWDSALMAACRPRGPRYARD